MTERNEKIILKYLMILPENLNTKEALFNLLKCKSTLDFQFKNKVDIIILKKENYPTEINIKKIEIKNKNNKSHFIVSLSLDNVEIAKKFDSELNTIDSNINVIDIELLHDGISRYYSIQAYKVLHKVETSLRAFITELMVFYGKEDWHTKIDKNKTRNNHTGIKILYSTNFDQLSSFLFEDYSDITHKDLIEEIINKNSDEEKLDFVKDLNELIPKPNWDKLIAKDANKQSISGEQFKKLLDNIYKKRNRIAHCNEFIKKDFDEFNSDCEKILKSTEILTEIIESKNSEVIFADENISEDLDGIFFSSDQYDTIVVPAKPDGFEKVFLKNNEWYSVAIYENKINSLKYIAAYISQTKQKITHYAEIDRIETSPYDEKKKIIYFKDSAKELPKHIELGVDKRAFQRSRYTVFNKLINASTTDDLFES